ncbi:F-box-like domain superfamily [Sesbania bispinosa]|nr:F-box-like domain superfamily [Sesbania bispinosa]
MTLCEDELFHIFSWLPAKALCRFKCSCEWFLQFSKEAYFCMKQAQNMLLKDDTCFIVQPNLCQWYRGRIECHPLPEEKSSSGVPKKFLTFLEKSSRILASSNGLALYRSTYESPNQIQDIQLFICNLVTQSWLPIATPCSVQEASEKDIDVVFNCINNDFDLDDYRIFFIEKPPEWSSYLYLKMYLPKEGVWKDMEKSFFIGSRSMRLHMPVFLHNALHFISDTSPYIIKSCHYFRPYIMAYNLESCQSTMRRLPKDARRGSHDKSCEMGIFEWGKKGKSLDHSICLVRYMKFVFTIWVLEDYKSNGWRRILKIRVKAMGLKEADPEVQGFTIMNGDCLIFATNKKVYGYDFSGKKSWRFKEICDHEWGNKVCFTSYSNTLRPCGTGATTFPT